jgi:hypothetical protein
LPNEKIPHFRHLLKPHTSIPNCFGFPILRAVLYILKVALSQYGSSAWDKL